MTTELFYLTLSALLLASMWIPFIIGQVQHGGVLQAEDYAQLRDTSKYPAWVRRANRAHMNLVEQFAGFAAVVLVANAAGYSTALTATLAAAFFWLRVAHVIIMISGTGLVMIRTLVFTAAWASIVIYGIALLIA